MKTYMSSVRSAVKPFIAVLCFSAFIAQTSFASRHKGSITHSPTPVESIATTAASSSNEVGSPWLAVLMLVIIIALLVRRLQTRAAIYAAALQSYKEKIEKQEEDAYRLRRQNDDIQKEISSIRTFTDQRLIELSDALKQIKALELRLKLILAAIPEAEILAKEKAKGDAEIEAVKAHAREKVALQNQGGVCVQAFLNEIKRG